MDGNRGAKGSVKDRLISMLYRLRYSKKVKKVEEYTIDKKEKQVEYIKLLQELDEKENIDILDSKDKDELDQVHFDVNYKVKQKGIDEIDLDLYNIEYKTSELDEKVDLKKEVKKTENEVVILKEVNTFINKSKETLVEINKDVESLKEMSKNKNQDTNELEYRYKKLREKVDKLKKQYDTVKEKYDLSEFSILESIKLMDNIKDYKSVANLNEMEMMVKVCKKEIDQIKVVEVEYKETKKVGNNIDNIKKDQSNIKIKFKKNKEEINQIKNTSEDINEALNKEQAVIDDMYKQASYIKKIMTKEIEYSGYSKIFSSMLKIAGGILTLPFTGSKIFGMALGNTMINRGLKVLNEGLEKKEKIVYKYEYTDIAHKISEVKDKVEYTNLIISDNLNHIKRLKENFKIYSEYNNVLNDYDSVLNKLEMIEEKLKLQQEKINNMDKKLETEKKMNEEKMQKVLKYKDNN